METLKRFWSKLENKTWVIATTIVGFAWPVYVAVGNPLGVAPGVISTVLWVLTGIVIVRLIIVVVMLTLIHRAYVKSMVK